MSNSKPGTGSACAYAARNSKGEYLDGGKTYKITLPSPIPAKQFWSFMVYDGQTGSMLETDHQPAGPDSTDKNIQKNTDGSVTVWFAPKAPAGDENNWVQTCRAKAGIGFCASTGRWSPGSIRRGSGVISNRSNERLGPSAARIRIHEPARMSGSCIRAALCDQRRSGIRHQSVRKADLHAISPAREHKPLALCLELQGDAFVVRQPKIAATLVCNGPSKTSLTIHPFKIGQTI
jgi:hypothetical protein